MSKIIIPLAESFNESELQIVQNCLMNAGHMLTYMGLRRGEILYGDDNMMSITVEHTADYLYPADFDAVVIVGGDSIDTLCKSDVVISFIKGFVSTERIIAAVGRGPLLLLEADSVNNRCMTSSPDLREKLSNVGAKWLNRETVQDRNLITSRSVYDLDRFCRVMMANI